MNFDTLKLIFFTLIILISSIVNEPSILTILIGIGLLASYPHTRWVLFRTLLFPLIFTTITLGSYTLINYITYGTIPENLPLILLRIGAMSIWSFSLVKKVHLINALQHFKGLQFMLVITLSQIELFSRSAQEARRAYKSRSITSPSLLATLKFYAGLYISLLEKALASSKNVSKAMRSRGVFDA